jgi:hypothetical protein
MPMPMVMMVAVADLMMMAMHMPHLCRQIGRRSDQGAGGNQGDEDYFFHGYVFWGWFIG